MKKLSELSVSDLQNLRIICKQFTDCRPDGSLNDKIVIEKWIPRLRKIETELLRRIETEINFE